MVQRTLLLSSSSSVVAFIFNLYSHQNLLIAILNALTVGLSVYFFQKNFRPKASIFNTFLLISAGLIPLFHYFPKESPYALLPIVTLVFIYLYTKYTNRLFIILFASFLLIGNFHLNEMIKYPFEIQYNQLIFNSPEINLYILKHQQDALFIPYKLRLIVYSNLVFLYALFTNFFNSLTLKSLTDALLIANLYPLFIGLYHILNQKTKLAYLIIMAFTITVITSGIDRSTDIFQTVYLMGPLLILLILLGGQSINKKVYLALWLLTFFLFISPKL